ncbi:MAG TPA: SAF domain-containing protein [Jatrophihabitans sp.]|uniref:SAF domain-containing protein n=1 Tax=Jatrophihabitans sp. TaxID=1932789 RepID=UPI002E0365D0|nr:SAF domain-containing protein [Jatrophihabitans sp.]
MTVSSPPARRIATPSWLDLRLVLGVLLVLVAVLLGAVVVSGASHTSATVAATHDLAAGTILRPSDLSVAQVQLPAGHKRAYLATIRDAVGKKLARPVSAGELVPAAAVAAPDARTTLTVPFASGTAPDLRSGQRIEIFLSTSSCTSVVLLPEVTVQSVRRDTGGSFASGTGGQDVVIMVDPALAGRVVAALAIDRAQIRAGVLGGTAPPPAPAPQAGAGGAPPADIAACASPSTGR